MIFIILNPLLILFFLKSIAPALTWTAKRQKKRRVSRLACIAFLGRRKNTFRSAWQATMPHFFVTREPAFRHQKLFVNNHLIIDFLALWYELKYKNTTHG